MFSRCPLCRLLTLSRGSTSKPPIGKKQRFYAAKIPSKGGEEEARREIEVLTKTKELNCLHVLKLVDAEIVRWNFKWIDMGFSKG